MINYKIEFELGSNRKSIFDLGSILYPNNEILIEKLPLIDRWFHSTFPFNETTISNFQKNFYPVPFNTVGTRGTNCNSFLSHRKSFEGVWVFKETCTRLRSAILISFSIGGCQRIKEKCHLGQAKINWHFIRWSRPSSDYISSKNNA